VDATKSFDISAEVTGVQEPSPAFEPPQTRIHGTPVRRWQWAQRKRHLCGERHPLIGSRRASRQILLLSFHWTIIRLTALKGNSLLRSACDGETAVVPVTGIAHPAGWNLGGITLAPLNELESHPVENVPMIAYGFDLPLYRRLASAVALACDISW